MYIMNKYRINTQNYVFVAQEFLARRLCVDESDLYWAGNSDGNWADPDSKQHNCAVLKGNTQEDISCLREERSICEIPCLQ